MSYRLFILVPLADAQAPRFRFWRSERTNGFTATLSLGFERDDEAMTAGHALPYVWAVEPEGAAA